MADSSKAIKPNMKDARVKFEMSEYKNAPANPWNATAT
jgi:hypothetical protein